MLNYSKILKYQFFQKLEIEQDNSNVAIKLKLLI